ncbi:MAG: SpoIID/LytB domain-containing protein [Clostridia bacterium]|nr:SpoIID/LytB domain-containing protein [Clostridia bacterium]
MSSRNKRARGRRLAIRILACMLSLVTLIGAVYVAMAFSLSTSALPLDSYKFSTEKTSQDFRIAVGIRYGTSAFPLHPITSPNGFVFGEAEISKTAHNFTPVYSITETDIAAVVDTNLTVGYETCEIAKSEEETDIGGYHVELSLAEGEIWKNLGDLTDIFSADYGHVFPAYINGKKTLRIGAFPNYSEANAAAAAVATMLDGFKISVASPSSSGVCYLNSDYDTILFEYSGSDGFCSGVAAVQKENTDYSYLYYSQTSYLYDGVFCFKRYLSEGNEGLSMINLVEMQAYVEGVVPHEISSTWPLESLKAFSIMVRSFAMANLNHHYSAYGFDICCTSCCQVYQGRRLVTNSVIEAVEATKNQIMVHGNKIATASYSSSQGGYSVASQYAWGGTLDYLTNQPTPWEDYCDIKNGTWTAELTPEELAAQFKNAGYSSIQGNKIVEISYQTSDDSPYLYSFTGIDEKGNSATATRSARVKSLFGSYVRSANFTIAKGELTYKRTDVIENTIVNLKGTYTGEVSVYTDKGTVKGEISLLNFFTDIGKAIDDASAALFAKTKDGTAVLTASDVDIPVSTMPDANGYYTIVSNFGDFLIISEVRDIVDTIKAGDPDNYVLAGMGRGHGVGASQYGILHLAKAGATYDQIIRAYYVGTEIVNIGEFFK